VLLHIFAYYDIINETFLGGSMLILFVALHKYMEDRPLKRIMLVVSMFFVIWGHPDMLLTLGVFLPFIYSDVESVKRDWRMVVFILINLAVRSVLLADYDMGKINLVDIHSFPIHNLTGKGLAYLREYWFIAILVACMLYTFYRSKNKFVYAGLLLTPILLAYVDAYHIKQHVAIWFPDVTKYLYPIHLFSLLQTMIFVHSLSAVKLRWALSAFALLLLAGITTTFSYEDILTNRARVIKNLNTLCARQNPTHSKWYVRMSKMHDQDTTLDQSNEGMVFSARSKQPTTVHLVWADDAWAAKLDTVPADMLYPKGWPEIPIKRLDPYYFNLKSGAYTELVLDSATERHLAEYDLQ
jgi:hypothetical protein